MLLLASFIVLELLFREKDFVSFEEAAADPSPVGPGGSLLVVMVVLSYYLSSEYCLIALALTLLPIPTDCSIVS